MGNTYKAKGDLDEAIQSYSKALDIRPALADAYANLCEIHEKLNALDDLEETVDLAKKNLKKNTADMQCYEALLAYRANDYTLCSSMLDQICDSEITISRLSAFYSLRGMCYDKLKNHSSAFDFFCKMNENVIKSTEYRNQNPDGFFNSVKLRVSQLREISSTPVNASDDQASNISLTFMIGFPRSGTTLLDTILRCHSEINVLEEKPMLSKVRAVIGADRKIGEIENFDSIARDKLRDIYLNELSHHGNIESNELFVDKQPLNLVEVPLMHRLFPTAKYILALRHPLDCILSCFMQSFRLNPSMVNMFNLDRIVDLYCAAMEILSQSNSRYSLDIHRICYENMVEDMQTEVSSLLSFLNLEWQPGLREYQETALRRKRIKTASYAQVIQSIYKDAAYRWKNYEEHLSGYIDKLEPWLKEFGYSSIAVEVLTEKNDR